MRLRILNSIFITLFLVVVLGLGLKFLKTPYHTIIMAAGIVGELIVGILYLLIKERERAVLSLMVFGWGLYLISVVKFLPQIYFLIVAILLSILGVVFLLKSKKIYLTQAITVGLVLITAIVFASMPKYKRYYLLNIHYSLHVEYDYWSWDKYSWFLNLAGKNEEALEANERAYSIVEKTDDKIMKDLIHMHQQKLIAGNWERYK